MAGRLAAPKLGVMVSKEQRWQATPHQAQPMWVSFVTSGRKCIKITLAVAREVPNFEKWQVEFARACPIRKSRFLYLEVPGCLFSSHQRVNRSNSIHKNLPKTLRRQKPTQSVNFETAIADPIG